MSFSLTDCSGRYREQLVVTPYSRKTEALRLPAETSALPDGVQLDSTALKGQRNPIDPKAGPPYPAASAAPSAAHFSDAEIQDVTSRTAGDGRWSRLSTDSGVCGEILEGSDGVRFRVLLPSGVLPEPVLIEREPGTVKAHSLGAQPHDFAAREQNGRVEVDILPGKAIAVFDEQSYVFGMESPERLEADHTYTRRETGAFLAPDGDGYEVVTYGNQVFRQNMAEYVHPDGTRELMADRERIETFQQAGHDQSISYYSIQTSPAGKVSAKHVVKGQDTGWFSDPYSTYDHHGTASHPLNAQRAEDGSYLLTPAGAGRRALSAVTNRVRNFGRMIFVGDQLQAKPADLAVVKPFSANP